MKIVSLISVPRYIDHPEKGMDVSLIVEDETGIQWSIDVYDIDDNVKGKKIGLSVSHATDEDFCADINVTHGPADEDQAYGVTWC